MTDKEYRQKRRECWDEFKREDFDDEEQLQIVSPYYVFCEAFDRAYALGKQKETITQEEIESKAVGYAMDVNNKRLSTYPEAMRPQLYPEYDMDDLASAFEAGANFALGKQEENAEGEEMLTCDRDVVRMLYDRADSVKVRQTLESLFGSKCLPDETNLSESLTRS